MDKNTNMLDIIQNMVEEELRKYATKLSVELTEKYKEEFKQELNKYRSKVVLDICGKIKMDSMYNPEKIETNITIKL